MAHGAQPKSQGVAASLSTLGRERSCTFLASDHRAGPEDPTRTHAWEGGGLWKTYKIAPQEKQSAFAHLP